jgi:PASTA domain
MSRRRVKATGKTWAIRAAIGLSAGLLVGFALGALTVRLVQPPGAVAVADADSSRIRKPRVSSEPEAESPAEQESAKPVNGVVVPQLIGMEEGDARNAITRAGFTIGTVTFKSSPEPLGTVVESFPVPGEAVPLPATVSLILSDGKGRTDSLPPSLFR